MLPLSPIPVLLYLQRSDSACLTRCLLRCQSCEMEREITDIKNSSPVGTRALNPPFADLWDAAGWDCWSWFPAAGSGLLLSWRYRHLAAGVRQASWSPCPTGHKTAGQAGKEKTQRSSKLTTSTFQKASLQRARRRRCQCHYWIRITFPMRAHVEQRDRGTLGSETFLAFGNACHNLEVAHCLVLIWVTRHSLHIWLQKVCGFPGVCLSLPPRKQNCMLISGNVIKIDWIV